MVGTIGRPQDTELHSAVKPLRFGKYHGPAAVSSASGPSRLGDLKFEQLVAAQFNDSP
jgi:hypothetical protein